MLDFHLINTLIPFITVLFSTVIFKRRLWFSDHNRPLYKLILRLTILLSFLPHAEAFYAVIVTFHL